MEDVRLICMNALLYNGKLSPIYTAATQLRQTIWTVLDRHETELTGLELALNTHVVGDSRACDEMELDRTRCEAETLRLNLPPPAALASTLPGSAPMSEM